MSTTLKFDVDIKGATADGKIAFVLKNTKTGSTTTSELLLGGKFTQRFKNGVLTIGLAFSQRAINGTVAARELTFTGKLVHKGGTQFAWELKAANGSTSIAIAASQIKLGQATASSVMTLKMRNGETQAVKVLFGVSF